MRIDRRQFMMGSAALAASLGVSPAFAQQAMLRLIFWGGQPRADRTYGVTDLYTEANPDVSIDGEFLGWEDYWTKLATQTAGGNAPDICQMDYRYIVEYARRNTLVPLDEYVGGVLDLSNFDEDQIDGGRIDGSLYGISLGSNAGSTLYNATALSNAGIEIDPMSMTYPELLEAGARFAEAQDGMKLLSDGSGVELLLENWLRQKGKALYTAEGEPAFEASDLIEWFQLWNELRAADACVSAEVQAADVGPAQTSVLTTGQAATAFKTSNQLVAFQEINEDNIDIAIYPKISEDSTGGHYRKPSMFFSVTSSSQDPEAAAHFINFFVNDIEAGRILGVERGIPADSEVRQAIAPELDEKSRAALEFVANLGELAGPLPPPPPPAAGEIEKALITKSQEVAFGMQSPEDAGQAFFDEVNSILERGSVN
ncbi:ABC transporter ATP-binding protein [Devosia pacifica]|uniref:ABC transporter ATP-binding protein n=1 Tax=Devosia pacifica TaxID=1335967 RepID=A0A918SG05_9HYPH|nr:ABC transporter substrate-binding protein [Devosia pacifica]GHA36572.1 ABC transporter ATP-binding protein [Devosia pacifica]